MKTITHNIKAVWIVIFSIWSYMAVGQCITTPSIDGNITHLSCRGCTDGEIEVLVSGGSPPYTGYWIDGSPFTLNRTNLRGGSYTIIVSDVNGCIASKTFGIYTTCGINISVISVQDETCALCADGAIDIDVTGGTPPYRYQWGNEMGGTMDSTQDITGRYTGNYWVAVWDANGCSNYKAISINNPICQGFDVEITVVSGDPCLDPYNVVLAPSHIGGQAPYWGHWFQGQAGGHLQAIPFTPNFGWFSDSNRCAARDTFLVGIQLEALVSATSCMAPIEATVTVIASNGMPPYEYSVDSITWQTWPEFQNVTVGQHTLYVRDAAGCYGKVTTVVSPPPTISAIINHPTCAGCNDGSIYTNLDFGGLGYANNSHWSPVVPGNNGNLGEDTYHLTVTYNGSCEVEDSFLLSYNCFTSATVSPDVSKCKEDTVQLSATGGASYTWSPGSSLFDSTIANPLAMPLTTTTYTVVIDDGNGCVNRRSVKVTVVSCVWPGDTNIDGIVNNDDVLNIGIGYGFTGPVRNNASLIWVGQMASWWSRSFVNGYNYRVADTNGDGIINSDDTLAIQLNYGLTHLKTDESRTASNPDLYIDMPDTATAGETVFATIYLGRDTAPVQNVYGIKFSVLYDNTLVDTNTVHLYLDTSWMGTPGTDLMGFTKDLYDLGRADFAITRTNRVSVNGGGPIGLLSFTMKDDVSGKGLLTIPMDVEALGVRAIDELENELTLTAGGSTVVVTQDTTTGIKHLLVGEIKIFPNPATGTLQVHAPDVEILGIKLMNVLGQEVMPTTFSSDYHAQTLNVSTLSRGVFLVHVSTSKGIYLQRIVLN